MHSTINLESSHTQNSNFSFCHVRTTHADGLYCQTLWSLSKLLVTKLIRRITQQTGDDLLRYVALCSAHWFARLRDLQQVSVSGLQSHFANTIRLLQDNLPDFMHWPVVVINTFHQHRSRKWLFGDKKNILFTSTTTMVQYQLNPLTSRGVNWLHLAIQV